MADEVVVSVEQAVARQILLGSRVPLFTTQEVVPYPLRRPRR
jgi:hypothetical protein